MIKHILTGLLLLLFSVEGIAQKAPKHRVKGRHQAFTVLLKKHVVNGKVDYEAFRNSREFEAYLKSLEQDTVFFSNRKPSKESQIAFWINAYNAFTIHLITKNTGIKSIMDIRPNAWREQFFTVAGKKMTLDEIEKTILIKELGEDRVHFTCVCAAVSCPPLQSEAYEGFKLEAQLERAARNFINDTLRNEIQIGSPKIKIAQIFNWYSADFSKFGGVKSFLARYLDEPKRSWLLDGVKEIEYFGYDWSLNSK
ncbi:MAG: DUF547 domain-containing protein [Chloroherpetonaceae bacterium]|nr:DUF547 domain-containing protein [Chloroherpetonaceae bacterium]